MHIQTVAATVVGDVVCSSALLVVACDFGLLLQFVIQEASCGNDSCGGGGSSV